MSEEKKIPDPPVKICFERIIPDNLDQERMARRSLREYISNNIGGTLDASATYRVARMAINITKRWPKGSVIKCHFLDGSNMMRERVVVKAKEWEKYANIKFEFVNAVTAEIRISFFADAGSWSALGKDALNTYYFPLHQPTMNLGWLRDNTDDDEYSRVVMHEFGHCLACLHEHSGPRFSRKWNVDAVMKYFQGPPNYWTPEEIEYNVLKKYSPEGIIDTPYDPLSIMLYDFDASLFADGFGPTNSNIILSELDKSLVGEMYPRT